MDSKEMMAKLRESVGKPVRIEYIFFGGAKKDDGVLKSIQPYERIELKQPSKKEGGEPLLSYIPFLDTKHGIQKITGKDEEILYQNPLIIERERSSEEIRNIAIKTFGLEIADMFFPEKKIKAVKAVRTEAVEAAADPVFVESLTE